MSAPIDLYPAEPEPPSLLKLLRQSLAVRQLCDAVINSHRTTETTEED